MFGKIKKLTDKGYGFITKEEGGDAFFHAKDLDGMNYDELREGDRVEFEMVDGEKGPKAVGVIMA